MRCQVPKSLCPVYNLHGKKRLKKCTSLLRDCRITTDGKLVHGHVLRSELQLDSHFWVSLVNAYAQCGSTLYARKVLDKMHGPVPCLKKYSMLLSVSSVKGSIMESKVIHGNVIRSGLVPDSHLWGSMVNAYVKCGSVLYAERVFDSMPVRDVVSWTALVSGYVDEGRGGKGVSLIRRMQREGVGINDFSLAIGLKACAVCFDLDFGRQLHTGVVKLGFGLDFFVGSALVDFYVKCGEVECAERVFYSINEMNVILWNALLNGYAERGDGERVMKLFYEMKDMEIRFSKFTLVTVLKGCVNSGYIIAGKVVHSLAIKLGIELEDFFSCILLDMYSKCGLTAEALAVFKTIKDPDVVVWSTVLTCLENQGFKLKAVELFNVMRFTGIAPNQFTLATLVAAATDVGDMAYGESLHACICKYGFEPDNVIGNALVTFYMQNGCFVDAARIFESIANKDLVSWNSLLSGFQGHVLSDLGPKIFYQVLLQGFKPNTYTFDSILKSCSDISDVAFGKQVHAHVMKNSFNGDRFVGPNLVYMYAKCGCVEDAIVAFNSLIERDIFAWMAIIAGFAQADQAEETIKWFRNMQQEGLQPNEFTLSSCASGCSNLVTLDSGRLLHSMSLKTGHLHDQFVSTSLVDMYGKCGCIEEAEAVFRDLALRDTVSWNAMIGVYVQHGEREKAVEAYGKMLGEGVLPDDVTFKILVYAYICNGLSGDRKNLLSSVSKMYGITPSVEHHVSTINNLHPTPRVNCMEVENYITQMKRTPNPSTVGSPHEACI